MPSKGIFSSFSCCTSLPKDSGNTTPNGTVKTTSKGGCCTTENFNDFKEDVGEALGKTHEVIIKLAKNVDKAAKKLDVAIPVLITLLEASKVIFAADKDLKSQLPQIESAIQYLKLVQETTKRIREVKTKDDASINKPIPATPAEVAAVVAEANNALRDVDDYAKALKALQQEDQTDVDPKLDEALKTVVNAITKTEERAAPFVSLAKIALDPTADVATDITTSVSDTPSAPAAALTLA